jgi:hypothetical protein
MSKPDRAGAPEVSKEMIVQGRVAYAEWEEAHLHLQDDGHYVSDYLKDELIERILTACNRADN